MSETENAKFVPDHDSIFDAYNQLIMEAPFCNVMRAATWYSEAQSFARELSIRHGVNLDIAAGIIAAFSPRTKWASNMVNAEIFFQDKAIIPTLGNNIRMAQAVFDQESISALKGRKTNSFAHNIAGDMSKVTIDVWMIRAAGYDRLDANKGMYDLMETVIIELAEIYSVSPAQLQALIWIQVRGSHV